MTGTWRFWAWPWELKRCGVLGINARNLEMLLELNPRALHRLVDDKAATKEVCRLHAIPTPATYAIVERFGQLGLREQDIERVTQIALTGYFTGISLHPKKVEKDEIVRIYRSCL